MPYNFVPDSFHTSVTAEALRAKIERKSTISHQRGHFDRKFKVQGVAPPPIIFAQLVRPMNALQLCRWVFTQVCSRLSSSEVRFFYDDHHRLIGKRVGDLKDFLLASIELFSLVVTAEALRAIIGSKSAILLQRLSVEPKFQVEGSPPPTILLRKLG